MARLRAASRPGRWWPLALAVALVAYLARLLPVLRSGGLDAIDQYDASVYFGSSLALVHGRLPYRDFLLLHPPGITLALTPFAVLARAVGDSAAMSTARLAWMALGALNAVLILLILKPLRRFAATWGALAYAVSLPAVTIEQTTRLEGPQATCLLAALALLTRRPLTEQLRPAEQLRPRTLLFAGALLGLAVSLKAWGVVALVVVVGFVLVTGGLRRAGWLTLGVAGAGTVVCLPFLLAAPRLMWRYVVTDQLARGASTPLSTRLPDLAGWNVFADQHRPWVPLAVAVVIGFVVGCAVVAWSVTSLRLVVLLLAALTALLLSTPTWFPHYAGLLAGPSAIVAGAGVARLLSLCSRTGAWLRLAVCGLLSLALLPYAGQLTQAEFGRPFRSEQVSGIVATRPGCVTADDPSTLIALDVLSRNLSRDCALILDLGGYSYDLNRPGQRRLRRAQDFRWQHLALSYLGSGSATMVTRYSTTFGFSAATVKAIHRWPVLASAGRYSLRQPHH